MSPKTSATFDSAIYGVATALAGLILPVVLIVPIRYLGHSEVIEELAKLAVIFLLVMHLPNKKQQIMGALLFGLVFALSEHGLYAGQILQHGDWSVLWRRCLLFVTPLHMLTSLVLVLGAQARRWFMALALLTAIALHLVFNAFVPSLLLNSLG